VWADISATETGAHVRFVDPQAGVAPGQACVIYDGSKVLGGGWILRH
jgi:tRNA-specific 2-thiouridylase